MPYFNATKAKGINARAKHIYSYRRTKKISLCVSDACECIKTMLKTTNKATCTMTTGREKYSFVIPNEPLLYQARDCWPVESETIYVAR